MALRSLIFAALAGVAALGGAAPVQTGLDVLIEDHLDDLRGKRVAIACNHTALTADGTHIVDALHGAGVEVAALFVPEHGYRGDEHTSGQTSTDDVTGAPIYSLYDETRAPTDEELEGIDVMLFDIQDIGCRFYTYISTMGVVIEACASNEVSVFILDRPNPITGLHPEGAVASGDMLRGFTSFYPIPTRHALTVGELARMAVGEGWLQLPGGGVDLTVVECRGWTRMMDGDSLDRAWVRTSPNMPGTATAITYPGLGLLEGINLSEGRGTDIPFILAGATWVSSEEWARALRECDLPGVAFTPITYRPGDNGRFPSRAIEYLEQPANGVVVTVLDRTVFRPVRTGLAMLWTATELYPESVAFTNGLNSLSGDPAMRETIEAVKAGTPPEGGWRAIADRWDAEAEAYWERAQAYLIYE